MNRERLQRAAQFLRNVVEPRQAQVNYVGFDMWIWGEKADTPCGFAGCAIGHLAFGKVFDELVFDVEDHRVKLFGSGLNWAAFEKLSQFFDIESIDAKLCFDPVGYNQDDEVEEEEIITPLMVAERIERVLAADGKS